MGDWRSYDAIADDYERLWEPFFDRAAQQLLRLVPLTNAARLLDIGTGTGAVPAAVRHMLPSHAGMLVGCDLSSPMVARARRGRPWLTVMVADARRLPLRDGAFDVVTASFSLTHVTEYGLALREALRLLRPGGVFAISNWAPAADPYEPAWRELVTEAVGKAALERASQEVVPWDFADPETLRGVLVEGGFEAIEVETTELRLRYTAEEFVASRSLSSGGRFARHVLGDAWPSFRSQAEARLRTRFGDDLDYTRRVVIGAGRAPTSSSAGRRPG